MTEQGRTQIQTLAAGFLGFVGVVGLGSLALLHRGGSSAAEGSAHVDVPADVGALAVPASVVKTPSALSGQDGSAQSSPAPLLSDEVRADAAADGAAAVAPAAPAGAAPKLAAGGLPSDAASSAASSAQVSAAAAPAAKKAVVKKTALAKKPFFMPKLDLSKNQGTIASTVHYGVSDRSELMGRAAGPVNNFSGKGLGGGQGAKVAAGSMDAAGALQQVDAAQKQVDSSDPNGAERTQIDQSLNQIRQTVSAGGQ